MARSQAGWLTWLDRELQLAWDACKCLPLQFGTLLEKPSSLDPEKEGIVKGKQWKVPFQGKGSLGLVGSSQGSGLGQLG